MLPPAASFRHRNPLKPVLGVHELISSLSSKLGVIGSNPIRITKNESRFCSGFCRYTLIGYRTAINLLCDTLNLLVNKQDEVSIFNNHFNIKYIVNGPE